MSAALTLGTREEKKAFYARAFKITLPIALQNLMDAAVGSADVLMLTFVSQTALSASSLAGQVNFVLSMLMYGISSGATVLASQYWGKGDKLAVEKVMGLAIRISVAVSLLVALAALCFPSFLMTIFTDDKALIDAGCEYLRAVCASYVFNAFAVVYLSVMRSVERVKMSAVIHISAVGMNVFLNACFIFGLIGFPKLGITGVALATSITRAIEVCVCLIDNAKFAAVRLRLKHIFGRSKALFQDFMRFSLPAAANDILWGLAFSMYSVILGHLSSDIVAANSLASVVRGLGTVTCFGVSNSAAIILGKAMGDNKLKEAEVYGARFLGLSVLTAAFGGIVILLCGPLTASLMQVTVTVTDTVRDYLKWMIYINAYYIFGQSVNTMLICGLFRAGGDVRFGLACDALAMWLYAVPVGFLCAFVLKIPEMWVYFVLCLDEFVKMPFIIHHYRKKKWLRNITRERI